ACEKGMAKSSQWEGGRVADDDAESDTESYQSEPESDLEKAEYARREPVARFRSRDALSAYSSSSRETSGSHQHLLSRDGYGRKVGTKATTMGSFPLSEKISWRDPHVDTEEQESSRVST
ncbi:MAG: hypothetical protein Q9180_008165, partial [Flavoplaca navasiana]